MLTADRAGKSTFSFGMWKSVYVLPLPQTPGVAITQMVPLTFYAGGHPITRLSDSNHSGFMVNVTLDLYAVVAAEAAELSVLGSWPRAQPVGLTVALKPGMNSVTLSIPAAQTRAVLLWHPHGHGEQPLYRIVASAAGANATRKIGFRHAVLVTINDTDPATAAAAKTQEGTGDLTMTFRVNGAAVYARGGSMVPMDLLNGRQSAEAYRRVIVSAAEGNFNTIRVWGGGIYMPRAFYDAADDFGILLYHDLMFTGKANNPADKWSLQIEEEVKYQIKRLSHHPAIMIWDSCNECKVSLL